MRCICSLRTPRPSRMHVYPSIAVIGRVAAVSLKTKSPPPSNGCRQPSPVVGVCCLVECKYLNRCSGRCIFRGLVFGLEIDSELECEKGLGMVCWFLRMSRCRSRFRRYRCVVFFVDTICCRPGASALYRLSIKRFLTIRRNPQMR